MDQQHQDLVDLAWRYAVLIDIVREEGIVTRDEARADKREWAHLVRKSCDGLPLFAECDAVEFIKAKSGLPELECLLVVRQEWSHHICSSCDAGALKPTFDFGIIHDDLHMVAMQCDSCDGTETRMVHCSEQACPWCVCNEKKAMAS